MVISERPKWVNTEITETEISVWFTEPKPIIPNRISQYIRFSNNDPPKYSIAFLLTNNTKFVKFPTKNLVIFQKIPTIWPKHAQTA